MKAVSTTLVFALLLVAFIGQAFAYSSSMPCETSANDQYSLHYNTLATNSTPPLTHKENANDCCEIDCCDTGCICIASTCSSVAYINAEVHLTNTIVLTEMLDKQHPKQPITITTLLYRPPISS